ncbi:hypothetical protein GTY41_02475 [Streptomyces sp. SID685]|nr:hypothetical protein [Streptomyces sp. SID685]MYR83840.1 hypothetical protein [Streptomyces sp. SID685]
MTTTPHHPLEYPMFEQPALFPESAVQTEGYAQTEPRDEAVDDDIMAEAA